MSGKDKIKALNRINKEEQQEYLDSLFDLDNINRKKSQSIYNKGNYK